MKSPFTALGILAGALLLLISSPAVAADGPDAQRAPDSSIDETEAIQVPAMEPSETRLESGLDWDRLVPRQVSPDPRAHKGEVYIDMGEGKAPGPLTAIEDAKMEIARAAIEASRAAGTLYSLQLPEDVEPASLEDLAAMKMQQYEARQNPAPDLESTRGALGPAGAVHLDPLQEVGSGELTQYEIDKFNGLNPTPLKALPQKATDAATVEGDHSSEVKATTGKEEQSND